MRIFYVSHGVATGYGVAGARLVRALVADGADVAWLPVRPHPDGRPLPEDEPTPFPDLDAVRVPAPAAFGSPDVTILHAMPGELPADLVADRGGRVVLHTVWETTALPRHWVPLLNAVDGVIVPTHWNAATFRASGVHAPIEVVPHIARPAGDLVDTAWLGPRPGFVVSTVAQWQPRKAPWHSVEAYCRAFAPDDDVLLVLKTGRTVFDLPTGFDPPRRSGHVSWALARLLGRLGAVPPIRLVDDDLTEPQLAGLHEWSDCSLSLPHGEGWDLGAFDAACHGNRVVTTGWGGPAEYLDPDAAWLVPATEAAPKPLPGRPEVPGTWAYPDLAAGAAALRAAAAAGPDRLDAVAAAARRLRSTHAADVVAGDARRALDRILAAPPAARR